MRNKPAMPGVGTGYPELESMDMPRKIWRDVVIPDPSDRIRNHLGFWHAVRVEP